jgi:hypothetical protein
MRKNRIDYLVNKFIKNIKNSSNFDYLLFNNIKTFKYKKTLY